LDKNINIGVFICNCGNKIADFIDLDTIEQFAGTQDQVTFASRLPYSCSKDGKRFICDTVKNKKLTHFVIAGCSPRIFENLFKDIAEEAGMNRHLVEIVNIREQCAWVHDNNSEKALEKTKKLLGMAIAKVKKNKPLETLKEKVVPSALIIGGGVAGLTAALSLAEKNIDVVLIEKEKELGGNLRGLYKIYPSMTNAEEYIRERVNKLNEIPHVEILTEACLAGISGFSGNYEAFIKRQNDTFTKNFGIIIVATGLKAYQSENKDYGNKGTVISQIDLEKMLLQNASSLKKAKKIIMLQCEGVRNEERPFCARVCCLTAVKNALILKSRLPDADITILYRDIPSFNERDRKRAEHAGIEFLQYNRDKTGIVIQKGKEMMNLRDISFDLLVLSVPLIPDEDSLQIHKILNIPADKNGFLVESQVRLRPGTYVGSGILLAGSVHYPSTIFESAAQGYSAAARGFKLLKEEKMQMEPVVIQYESEICRGCGRCVEACAFNAFELTVLDNGIKQVQYNKIMCKGCGVCTVVCPSGALQKQIISNEQIDDMLTVKVN